MSPKPLLLAALALAACETDTPAPAETSETAVAAPTPAAAPAATVQQTIDAIGTDVTALPAGTATANIDAWIETLGASDIAQAPALVERLDALNGQLAARPLDGPAIASTLADLGGLTTQAAVDATPEAQAGLATLGTALTDAGNSLSGILAE